MFRMGKPSAKQGIRVVLTIRPYQLVMRGAEIRFARVVVFHSADVTHHKFMAHDDVTLWQPCIVFYFLFPIL